MTHLLNLIGQRIDAIGEWLADQWLVPLDREQT